MGRTLGPFSEDLYPRNSIQIEILAGPLSQI
jgi:hypothetical protein